jgi:hypothetical protein
MPYDSPERLHHCIYKIVIATDKVDLQRSLFSVRFGPSILKVAQILESMSTN